MLDVTERYQQSENSSCSSYSSVVQHLAEEGPNSGCRQTRARGIRNQVSTCSRLLFNTRPVWLSLWSDSSDTWDWLIRVWTTERRAAGRLSLTRSPVKAAGHVHRTDASQWRLTVFHFIMSAAEPPHVWTRWWPEQLWRQQRRMWTSDRRQLHPTRHDSV